MQADIQPSRASGTISAPPSKSIAHRQLICAGLATGRSTIHGIEASEDISATIDSLRALGASITVEKNTATVSGCMPTASDGRIPLPCRESGTTLRFFIPLCMTGSVPHTLTGSKHLFSRPLDIYETIAREKCLRFEKSRSSLIVCGKLPGGKYRLSGAVSSQFISGLLFALPLLTQDSRIELITPITSAPYIALTLSALRDHDIVIEQSAPDVFVIPGNQTYTPHDVIIEGDYSTAANLDVFNLTGGAVKITGLNPHSLQGDRVYRQYMEGLQNGYRDIDLTDCPDLAPILFTVAALFHGAHFTGTERLRRKESDRISAMVAELGKCGVDTWVGQDEVIIKKGSLHAPHTQLCGHNDHRVVMALSFLLSVVGGSITDAEAVKKSYPTYFSDMQRLGMKVNLRETNSNV